MKIYALITDAFGGYGGIALYNRDLLMAFCKQKSTESVCALPRLVSQPGETMPINLIYRYNAAKSRLTWVMTLLSDLPTIFRSDMIYCAHVNLSPVAYALGFVFRKPVLCALYGIEAWEPTGRKLVDWSSPRLSHHFAISNFTRDRYAKWSGVPSKNISLLPNAIHLEQYGMGHHPVELEKKFDLAGKTNLLTLGRLVSYDRAKGFDEVLDLMPELVRDDPSINYIIAGTGDYQAQLEQKSRMLGVADHVTFTGHIPESDKADLYRLSSAYVMPSRGEGFGFVFLEAMACGVPVVASSADGSRDAVLDGKIGHLVDPDDREGLKAGILTALKSKREIPPGLDYFSFQNFSGRVQAIVEKMIPA